jgi:hypothetical protein
VLEEITALGGDAARKLLSYGRRELNADPQKPRERFRDIRKYASAARISRSTKSACVHDGSRTEEESIGGAVHRMALRPITTERQELREYLLGELRADAAEELDARLFAQDHLLDELQDEQDALIEDYLNDLLKESEASSFRAQVARSPSLQERVASFQILLEVLERKSTRVSNSAASRLPRLFVWLSPALAILLCFAIVLWASESRKNVKLKTQVVALSQIPQAISPSVSANSVAVAFLSANVVRGPSAPLQIATPATALVLELQIELTTLPKREGTWNAEVRRGDELIWQASQITVHRIGHETFLALFIDAVAIRPGTYEVRYGPASDPAVFQRRSFQITEPR